MVGAKSAKPNEWEQCQEPLRNQEKEFKNQSWQHSRESDVKTANVRNMLWPPVRTHAALFWEETQGFWSHCHSMANRGPERQYLQSRGLGLKTQRKHESRCLICIRLRKRKECMSCLAGFNTNIWLGLLYWAVQLSFSVGVIA